MERAVKETGYSESAYVALRQVREEGTLNTTIIRA